MTPTHVTYFIILLQIRRHFMLLSACQISVVLGICREITTSSDNKTSSWPALAIVLITMIMIGKHSGV